MARKPAINALPGKVRATFVAAVMLAVLATATTLAGEGSGVSSAQVAGSPSDPRATFIVGNVVIGDCQTGGQMIPESALTFSISGGGQFLTITAVDAGFTVTAIFVKGGDDTNLYEPGQRGLPASPPWTNLVAPLTNGEQLPAISHWFVCGSVTTTTTSTSTTTTTTSTTTLPPTTTSTTSTTTLPPTTTSTTSTTTLPPTTTSTTTVPPTTTTTLAPPPPPPTFTTTTTSTTTVPPTTTTTSSPAQPPTSTTTTSTTTIPPTTTTTTLVAALPPAPTTSVLQLAPTTTIAPGTVALPPTGNSVSLVPIALAVAAIGLTLAAAASRRREPPTA